MKAEFGRVSAAILAGGFGTRLRSAVPDLPKVLAPVRDRPFLAHLLGQLAEAGVRETVLLVGYAADRIRSTFGSEHAGMKLAYSTEPSPLGTGGAVRHALPGMREDTILLLNGDSYCDVDLSALLTYHHGHRGAVLTLAEVPDTSRYGRVLTTTEGRVAGFEEKGAGNTPGRINAGVYAFDRTLLEPLSPDTPISLEREVLPRWVAAGLVRGFPGGRFIDIGTPDSYREADVFFAGRGTSPPVQH